MYQIFMYTWTVKRKLTEFNRIITNLVQYLILTLFFWFLVDILRTTMMDRAHMMRSAAGRQQSRSQHCAQDGSIKRCAQQVSGDVNFNLKAYVIHVLTFFLFLLQESRTNYTQISRCTEAMERASHCTKMIQIHYDHIRSWKGRYTVCKFIYRKDNA